MKSRILFIVLLIHLNAFGQHFLPIQHDTIKASHQEFNCVLVNLYRDGKDSNGWHADNEPELGKNPAIASLSLGATRRFDLKHNTTKEKISINL